MKVYDVLMLCSSFTKCAVYDNNSAWIYFKDTPGSILANKHWILAEEVVELTINDNVLFISVEVE